MEEQISEISEPIQPVQSVSLEPKKKSNLPVIAIPACIAMRSIAGRLLIAILLIAGGVVLGVQIGKKQVTGGLLTKATPTPISQPTETIPASDATADWKTYRNEKYGFEIKYPLDWQVVEGQRINITNEEKQCFFSIDYSNLGKVTLPIESWFKKVAKEAEKPCSSPGCTAVGTEVFEKKETIGGVEAYKYGQGAGMGEIVGYFIPYKEKIITIAYNLDFYYGVPEEEQTTYCEDKSKQILSTFKFLDSSSVTQPVEPDGKQIGFIKKAYYQSGQQYIDIDYVEWLSGPEGDKACIEDKKCSADCAQIHCLPNGFYLRNNNAKMRTLFVVKNSKIEILDTSDSFKNKSIDFNVFQKNVSENIARYGAEFNLFWITVSNGKVVSMTEQYRP